MFPIYFSSILCKYERSASMLGLPEILGLFIFCQAKPQYQLHSWVHPRAKRKLLPVGSVQSKDKCLQHQLKTVIIVQVTQVYVQGWVYQHHKPTQAKARINYSSRKYCHTHKHSWNGTPLWGKRRAKERERERVTVLHNNDSKHHLPHQHLIIWHTTFWCM